MEKVFDTTWFSKHRSKLLWLANSWIGKYIFQFKKMGHYLENKIVKITPYSVGELISIKGKEVEIKEHFFSRNEYARKLYFYLYPLWLFMHCWDYFTADHFHLAPQLNFGFSSLTVNPGSIGTDNPVDGYVAQAVDNATWAATQGGAGNTSAYSGETGNSTWKIQNGGASGFVSVFRSIYCFDTSSLTSGATITAAVLSLFGTGKSDGLSISPTTDIYTATPAATNSLANGDFTQIGTTSQTGAAISYASLSATAYNDFTFNATGQGNVSKTGISKFGCRNANKDVANVAPSYVGAYVLSNFVANFSDNATNKPKLVVTYTLPAPAYGGFLYNML